MGCSCIRGWGRYGCSCISGWGAYIFPCVSGCTSETPQKCPNIVNRALFESRNQSESEGSISESVKGTSESQAESQSESQAVHKERAGCNARVRCTRCVRCNAHVRCTRCVRGATHVLHCNLRVWCSAVLYTSFAMFSRTSKQTRCAKKASA